MALGRPRTLAKPDHAARYRKTATELRGISRLSSKIAMRTELESMAVEFERLAEFLEGHIDKAAE